MSSSRSNSLTKRTQPLADISRSVQTTDPTHLRAETESNLGPTVAGLDQLSDAGNILRSQSSLSADIEVTNLLAKTSLTPGKPDSTEDSLLGVGDVPSSTASRGRSLKTTPTTAESPLSRLSSFNKSTYQLPPVVSDPPFEKQLDGLLAKPEDDEYTARRKDDKGESIPLQTLSPQQSPRRHASGGENKPESSGGSRPPPEQTGSNPPANPPQDGAQSGQAGPSGSPGQPPPPPPPGGDGSDPPDDKKKPTSPKGKEKADQSDTESQEFSKSQETGKGKKKADKSDAKKRTSGEDKIEEVPAGPPAPPPPHEFEFNSPETPNPFPPSTVRDRLRTWRNDARERSRRILRGLHPSNNNGSDTDHTLPDPKEKKPPKPRKK